MNKNMIKFIIRIYSFSLFVFILSGDSYSQKIDTTLIKQSKQNSIVLTKYCYYEYRVLAYDESGNYSSSDWSDRLYIAIRICLRRTSPVSPTFKI